MAPVGNLNHILTGKMGQSGRIFLGGLSMNQKLFKTTKTLQLLLEVLQCGCTVKVKNNTCKKVLTDLANERYSVCTVNVKVLSSNCKQKKDRYCNLCVPNFNLSLR